MARIHVHTHGKSHSTRPISKAAPSWTNLTADQVSSIVTKLSKEGVSPSTIGNKLRDEHGIPLAKSVTGKTVSQILAENNVKFDMPEDLEILVRKAIGLQKHLRTHNSDSRNVRSLELVESKIHRLSKYYKSLGRIPANWKYAAVVAQLE
ncbi:MAG: 30S ribosomal protein S15 [Nitrososphaera sp.]|nr:30S ribosomal protein S15 [Nitrososphaera sp.]